MKNTPMSIESYKDDREENFLTSAKPWNTHRGHSDGLLIICVFEGVLGNALEHTEVRYEE